MLFKYRETLLLVSLTLTTSRSVFASNVGGDHDDDDDFSTNVFSFTQ